jgi:hypothetical protein
MILVHLAALVIIAVTVGAFVYLWITGNIW